MSLLESGLDTAERSLIIFSEDSTLHVVEIELNIEVDRVFFMSPKGWEIAYVKEFFEKPGFVKAVFKRPKIDILNEDQQYLIAGKGYRARSRFKLIRRFQTKDGLEWMMYKDISRPMR